MLQDSRAVLAKRTRGNLCRVTNSVTLLKSASLTFVKQATKKKITIHRTLTFLKICTIGALVMEQFFI